MDYIRSYKKNKNLKGKAILILSIFAFSIFLLFFQIQPKSIMGESTDNNLENVIGDTCKFVVCISSKNSDESNHIATWGSGIIVSKDGLILTNEHVSGQKNSKCSVIIDNNEYDGKVIWDDDSLDLAIVKVDINFSNSINIEDNCELKLGQEVYSIGNPINRSFQKTVSKGIISGLNRNVEFEENGKFIYMSNLIQTDCAINYGSSGGALIDKYGNLIGVNTAKISDAVLIGFSLPAEVVKPIITRLEEDGSKQNASLKIWCYDKYSVQETDNPQKIDSGILVADIAPDSNAEKAGLRVGDIIKFIDTEEVNSVLNLKKAIFSKNVGDKILLKVSRNNKEMYINVELEGQK